MSEVLELAHFSQYDGVAEVNIGAGRVQAELDAQSTLLFRGGGELLGQLGFGKYFDRAAF